MIISVATQKGGNGKTTTAGIKSHILSKKKKKVLALDMDSQGSLTDMLTQRDIYDFRGSTIFEAIKNQSADGCIHKVSDYLDIMTSDDHLAILPRWLYTEYKGNKSLALANVINPIKDKYDYIIIDTPPALGDHTINSLAVSDAVVLMFGVGRQSYLALDRFIETLGHMKKLVNPNIKLLGILASMVEPRRSDHKALMEMVRETYGELVFDSTIQRRASTGRIDMVGFEDNTELNNAIEQYTLFVEEMLLRVSNGL
jgi:chromosome partitioning protein